LAAKADAEVADKETEAPWTAAIRVGLSVFVHILLPFGNQTWQLSTPYGAFKWKNQLQMGHVHASDGDAENIIRRNS